MNRLSVVSFLFLFLCLPAVALSQGTDRIAERYLQILKRNPRPGVAFDRVYETAADGDVMDQLIQNLSRNSDAGSLVVLGLIEQRRGQYQKAEAAFQTAIQSAEVSGMAYVFLAESRLAQSNSQAAIASFRDALKQDLSSTDQAAVYQKLGRLLQQFRPEESIELWEKYEQEFPDAPGVRQQVIQAFVDAGNLPAARKKLRSAIESERRPEDRIKAAIQLADLENANGNFDQAIQLYEEQLRNVRDGGWLSTSLRDRIQQTVRTEKGAQQLIAYYQNWLQKNPDDTDSMFRIATALQASGNDPQAEFWLLKATQRSPSNIKYLQALIQTLVKVGKTDEAKKRYQDLSAQSLLSEEMIVDWGRLEASESNFTQAAQIWRRLLVNDDRRPLMLRKVADLLASIDAQEEALAMYEQGAAESRNQEASLEDLGRYLIRINRRDQALKIFQKIAADSSSSVEAFRSEASLLQQFDFQTQALDTLKSANQQHENFELKLMLAESLSESQQVVEARQVLQQASLLVEDEQQRQRLVDREYEFAQAQGLEQAVAERQRLARQQPNVERWYDLAAFLQRSGDFVAAIEACRNGLLLKPDHIPSLQLAAIAFEKSGQLNQAVEFLKQLAEQDRRLKSQHLKQIAELQRKLGLDQAAIQTAESLVDLTPGQSVNALFLADLLFRQQDSEEGFRTLKKALRDNPKDTIVLKRLAAEYEQRFRNAEAIDIYWRVYRVSQNTSQRLETVRRLADLNLRDNRFEIFVQRLRSEIQNRLSSAEQAQCLAAAFEVAGDTQSAMKILESALLAGPDRNLLGAVVEVATQASDWDTALRYQQMIVVSDPSPTATAQLNSLLVRSGQKTADQLFLASPTMEMPASQLAFRIQTLLADTRKRNGEGQTDVARQIAIRLQHDHPGAWEPVLYLAMIAATEGRDAESRALGQQILRMKHPLADPCFEIQQQQQAGNVNAYQSINVLLNACRRKHLFGFAPTSAIPQASPLLGEALPLESTTPICFWEARNAILASQLEDESTVRSLIAAGSLPQASVHEVADAYMAVSALRQPAKEKSNTLVTLLAPRKENFCRIVLMHSLAASIERSVALSVSDATIAHCYQRWAELLANSQQRQLALNVATFLHSFLKQQNQLKLARQLVAKLQQQPDPQSLVTMLRLDLDDRRVLEILETILKQPVAVEFGSEGRTTFIRHVCETVVERLSAAGSVNDAQQFVSYLDVYVQLRARQSSKPRRKVTQSSLQAAATLSSVRLDAVSYSDFVGAANDGKNYSMTALDHAVVALVSGSEPEIRQAADDQLQQIATGPSPAATCGHLLLADLNHLEKRPQETLKHLISAAVLMPENAVFRLYLAQLFHSEQHVNEALQLLAIAQSADPQMIKVREQMALDWSLDLRNRPRAIVAAERLFGLRLDNSETLALAAMMRELGHEENAGALLNRVRRRSGNEMAVMVDLMMQYANSQQPQRAADVAQQILRMTGEGATSVARVSTTMRFVPSAEARRQAIAVLSKNGELEKLIQQTEQQLIKSPKATRLYDRLLEFVRASGDSQRLREVMQRIAEIDADSLVTHLQLAQRLRKSGDHQSACDEYLLALQQNAAKVLPDYFGLMHSFRKQGRLVELGDAILTLPVDVHPNLVKCMSQVLFEIGERSVRSRNTRSRLIQQLWEARPNERESLLKMFGEAELQNDEYRAAYIDFLLPNSRQQIALYPWRPLEGPLVFDRNQLRDVPFFVLMSACNSQQKAVVKQRVSDGLQQNSTWLAGIALTAILAAEENQAEQSAASLSQLFSQIRQRKSAAVPAKPLSVIVTAVGLSDAGTAEVLANLIQQHQKFYRNDSRYRDRGVFLLPLLKAVALSGDRSDVRSVLAMLQQEWTRRAGTPQQASLVPNLREPVLKPFVPEILAGLPEQIGLRSKYELRNDRRGKPALTASAAIGYVEWFLSQPAPTLETMDLLTDRFSGRSLIAEAINRQLSASERNNFSGRLIQHLKTSESHLGAAVLLLQIDATVAQQNTDTAIRRLRTANTDLEAMVPLDLYPAAIKVVGTDIELAESLLDRSLVTASSNRSEARSTAERLNRFGDRLLAAGQTNIAAKYWEKAASTVLGKTGLVNAEPEESRQETAIDFLKRTLLKSVSETE